MHKVDIYYFWFEVFDLLYFLRWQFSREKTPESVASEFSLVCANDYQRSLSKVMILQMTMMLLIMMLLI